MTLHLKSNFDMVDIVDNDFLIPEIQKIISKLLGHPGWLKKTDRIESLILGFGKKVPNSDAEDGYDPEWSLVIVQAEWRIISDDKLIYASRNLHDLKELNAILNKIELGAIVKIEPRGMDIRLWFDNHCFMDVFPTDSESCTIMYLSGLGEDDSDVITFDIRNRWKIGLD